MAYKNTFLCIKFSSSSLPEAVDNGPKHPLHEGYDAAFTATGNCQQLYPTCKESVWNSKFMAHK